RLQQVVGEAATLQVSPHPVVGKRVYLEHIDGIVFGDSPSQGVVRNNEFLHAGLGIALRFPMGWAVKNSPQKLVATNGDSAMALGLANFQGNPADYLTQRFGRGELSTFQSRDFSGAILVFSPRAEAGAIRMGDKLFVITALAKSAASFNATRPEIERAIHSFHPLSDPERKLARGLKITVRRAAPGDTFERYATKSPLGKDAAGYLRLLNHAYPDGEPHAGDEIKVVE
ncbi:MAG: hypothetical protein ACYCZR_11745, partial [Burkholderiales bacterium]